MRTADPAALDWMKGDGLLPAVVQDAANGQVLMLGYMNREALERTLAGGEVVFFSRSRGRLWRKGETSGNTLGLVDAAADCDGDTLRIRARPAGPVCHLGTRSCFGEDAAGPPGFLGELEAVIHRRLEDAAEGRPGDSYTARLAAAGRQRIAQKLGEEAVETALALAGEGGEALVEEAADLVYHLLVGLAVSGRSLDDVIRCLEGRHRDAQG